MNAVSGGKKQDREGKRIIVLREQRV